MKLFSWNVNGFRAVLKQGFMDWLEKTDPDLISLQEIRADWEQVDLGVRRELESAFDVAWFPSTAKKGYAGSATLSRKDLGFQHTKGLDIEKFDAEGRMVVSRKADLTVIAGYFPNASSGLVRLPFKREFSAALAAFVQGCHAKGEKVVVAGDMNVAPEDIDLARPKDNRMNPGFTDEEREDFRGYLAAGLVDILRERNPGVPGLYTWWTARGGAREKNVGWRIDNMLVSAALAPEVKEASIHPDVKGSDHCPVSLELTRA